MISVDDLSFTYASANAATLKKISFNVKNQEIFGFLGPSGAGKSTTQKLLIGLLQNYTGSAIVNGRQVRDWCPADYEEIGMGFELPNHHSRLTALENLQLFGALYQGPITEPLEVLRWVDLHEDANKKVAEFSKGMKIRLNVARSLLNRPKLLFLDEPTGGLDPVNAKRIKDLVKRIREEGTTVFLTTHDMTVADELCDRVAFINDGLLAAVDKPSSLKREFGKRQVEVQFTQTGQLKVEKSTFNIDSLATNAEFQALLSGPAHIESIHSQETTLEKVFIQITGQKLRS